MRLPLFVLLYSFFIELSYGIDGGNLEVAYGYEPDTDEVAYGYDNTDEYVTEIDRSIAESVVAIATYFFKSSCVTLGHRVFDLVNRNVVMRMVVFLYFVEIYLRYYYPHAYYY